MPGKTVEVSYTSSDGTEARNKLRWYDLLHWASLAAGCKMAWVNPKQGLHTCNIYHKRTQSMQSHFSF